ncbi:hypothetical protein Noda2021_01370 [Candidatus Dependentiae bacterium Noda2021]|nr:hypothetical protein Noda2021_01370 [Candidatus Dependentiae bacterium Noda2021]
MKKIILFTTLAACGYLLGVEKQYNNLTKLPPEIQYQIMEQLVNTARTRTEALQNVYNYALTQKMSADLMQQSKKYLQSLLDQKFGLYKFAFGDYSDPALKQKALSILEDEKKQAPFWAPGMSDRAKMAIADIKSGVKEIDSSKLESYLTLLGTALDDKKPILAMISLHFINQFNGTVDVATHDRLSSVEKAIDNIKKDPTNKDNYYVFDALIKIARNIFPKEYLLNKRIIRPFSDNSKYTIFEYSQKSGIPEVVDYLRNLGFDLMVDDIVEEPKPESYKFIPQSSFGYIYEEC